MLTVVLTREGDVKLRFEDLDATREEAQTLFTLGFRPLDEYWWEWQKPGNGKSQWQTAKSYSKVAKLYLGRRSRVLDYRLLPAASAA